MFSRARRNRRSFWKNWESIPLASAAFTSSGFPMSIQKCWRKLSLTLMDAIPILDFRFWILDFFAALRLLRETECSVCRNIGSRKAAKPQRKRQEFTQSSRSTRRKTLPITRRYSKHKKTFGRLGLFLQSKIQNLKSKIVTRRGLAAFRSGP